MKFGEYSIHNKNKEATVHSISDLDTNYIAKNNSEKNFDMGNLSIVQFNIERGYNIKEVIKLLKDCNADIICLQELDVGCIRSHQVNCAQAIANDLNMKLIYVVEFEEIDEKGTHGNAILSKLDFELQHVIMHTESFDWNNLGKYRGESRTGKRCTMVCKFNIKGQDILVYSAHLEVFTGILGRVTQISEIFDYAEKAYQDYQILCGDLNTLGHGIARLSPNYCNDDLRWKSIGYAESEFFYDRVLRFNVDDGPVNTGLIGYGLNEEVIKAARNPNFNEVFDLDEITLTNYGGAFQGKLDWLMVKGFTVKDRGMKNKNYEASDHKLLHCTITNGAFNDPNKDIIVKRKKLRVAIILSTIIVGISIYIKFKK